jgi:hypothetical protein
MSSPEHAVARCVRRCHIWILSLTALLMMDFEIGTVNMKRLPWPPPNDSAHICPQDALHFSTEEMR